VRGKSCHGDALFRCVPLDLNFIFIILFFESFSLPLVVSKGFFLAVAE